MVISAVGGRLLVSLVHLPDFFLFSLLYIANFLILICFVFHLLSAISDWVSSFPSAPLYPSHALPALPFSFLLSRFVRLLLEMAAIWKRGH